MQRKSFVIHVDSLEVLDELSDQQAAELLRAMRDYHLGKEIKLVGLMKAMFVPFKNQFDRDYDKYEAIVERNRANGAKGGVKPQKSKVTETTPVEPSGFQSEPLAPDSKSGSLSVNSSLNDNLSNTDLNTPLIPQGGDERDLEIERLRKELDKLKEKSKKKEEVLDVDYSLIMELFNSTCINIPKINAVTMKRKKAISTCLFTAKPDDLESFLVGLFQKVNSSDFLSGKKSDWRADFDFIFKIDNMIKIMEGSYDNTKPQQKSKSGIDFSNPETLVQMMRGSDRDTPF